MTVHLDVIVKESLIFLFFFNSIFDPQVCTLNHLKLRPVIQWPSQFMLALRKEFIPRHTARFIKGKPKVETLNFGTLPSKLVIFSHYIGQVLHMQTSILTDIKNMVFFFKLFFFYTSVTNSCEVVCFAPPGF